METFRRIGPVLLASCCLGFLWACASDAPTRPMSSVPSDLSQGWYHKVKIGDSVNGIADRYGRDAEIIAKANGLGNPAYLYENLYLWIPPTNKYTSVSSMPTPGPELRKFMQRPEPRSKSSVVAMAPIGDRFSSVGGSSKIPGQSQVLSQVQVREAQRSSRKPEAARMGFAWPVDPKEFKSVAQADRGLDILASKGAPVRAARDGRVDYSSTLRGYGNAVVIDHGDGYYSVYTNNDQNLVSKGARVKSGQTIAKVGTTGNAERPKVHFEIRKGTNAVDPLGYLPEL